MKSILSLSLLTLAVCHGANEVDMQVYTVAAGDETLEFFPPSILDAFHEWATKHEKVYSDVGEKLKKLKVWLTNHELIEAHNSAVPTPSYTLGHNEFSDFTLEEFQEYFRLGSYSPGVPPSLMGSKQKEESLSATDFEASLRGSSAVLRLMELQDEEDDEEEEDDDVDKKKKSKTKDWRKDGAVTSVKNQARCGSCWAFSATGAIEGSMVVHGHKAMNLSVEELVDCDKSDLGCSGGLMDQAFIAEEGWSGMCSWDDYPYDAPDHPSSLVCKRSNCTSVEGSAVKSFVDLSPGKNIPCTEKDLEKALLKQPVAVAIQANQIGFMFYKAGIMDANCGHSLDHGVLAVGFGVEGKKKFWIVKNSWGEEWGEEGYIRIARQSKEFDAPEAGQCGILMMPSYPVV